MKKPPLLLSLLLASVGITHGDTNPPDSISAPISQLEKAGQDFAQAAQLSGSLGAAGKSEELKALADEYRDFSNSFSSLNSYVQNGNYEEAVSIIRRWMKRTRNKQVRQSLATLLEALQTQRKKRIEEIAKTIDEAMSKASAALRTATNPDQVETIRLDLEDLRQDLLGSGGRDLQRFSYRIQNAGNFLENWRQMLGAENDGDFSQALSCLNQIRRNYRTEGLISQKEISDRCSALLERQLRENPEAEPDSPVLKAAGRIIDTVKSGKDAQAAAARMANLLRIQQGGGIGGDYTTINALTQRLGYIARLQLLLEQKAFQQVIESTYPWGEPWQPVRFDETRMNSIIADQKLAAIQALYPDAISGKAKAGENLSAFLRARAQEAYDAKDWPVLYQRLQALATTGGGNFQQGVRFYIVGGQLEKAALYREAVSQYASCIEQIGPFVPREEATAAVTRILRDHPETRATGKE